MMTYLLIAIGIYLLVGWLDAAFAHFGRCGRFSFRWIALGWPVAWWRDLDEAFPGIPDEDGGHDFAAADAAREELIRRTVETGKPHVANVRRGRWEVEEVGS